MGTGRAGFGRAEAGEGAGGSRGPSHRARPSGAEDGTFRRASLSINVAVPRGIPRGLDPRAPWPVSWRRVHPRSLPNVAHGGLAGGPLAAHVPTRPHLQGLLLGHGGGLARSARSLAHLSEPGPLLRTRIARRPAPHRFRPQRAGEPGRRHHPGSLPHRGGHHPAGQRAPLLGFGPVGRGRRSERVGGWPGLDHLPRPQGLPSHPQPLRGHLSAGSLGGRHALLGPTAGAGAPHGAAHQRTLPPAHRDRARPDLLGAGRRADRRPDQGGRTALPGRPKAQPRHAATTRRRAGPLRNGFDDRAAGAQGQRPTHPQPRPRTNRALGQPDRNLVECSNPGTQP